MIWGAFKRMFVTEVYARIVVAVLLAILGISLHSIFATVLALTALVLIYRLKYKRW